MPKILIALFICVSLFFAVGAGFNAKKSLDNSLNARMMIEKEMQR